MEIYTIDSQKEEEHICSECGGVLVQTFSDIVCSRCGLVQHQVFVEPSFTLTECTETPPGSVFVAQGNRPNIVDDLGSFIGHYRSRKLKDADGHYLSSSNQEDFQRQKKINDLDIHTQGKKREYRALCMLNALIGVLEISCSIRNDAAVLFNKTHNQLEGQVYIAEMIAGAVYISIRTSQGETIQLKDLLRACENVNLHVRANKVLQAAALIRKLTGRQIRVPKPFDYFEKILNKVIYDRRFSERLEKYIFPMEQYSVLLRDYATRLFNQIEKLDRGGRNPYVTACAAFAGADILVASVKCDKKTGFISQRLLAGITGVAEFTLRDHYLKIIKPLIKNLEIILKT